MTRRPPYFRKACNALLGLLSLISIVLAIGCMAWVLCTVCARGFSVLSADFLTSPCKPYGEEGAGIGNALVGTLLITGGAALLAVPPAMAAGIYMAEYGNGSRWAAFLRSAANIMMGLPSILIGLFVYVIIVVPSGHFSGLAGTVALAVIMFPIIMRTTEDMLNMVPPALRESALALGMTRMRATLCILTRAAKNGLATGVLLALARVSGETAPLLFTAMFAYSSPSGYFREPTANLPVLINEYTMNSPFESMHEIGWGAALVISIIILTVNIITRILFREQSR